MKKMALIAAFGCATILSACGGGTASQTLSQEFGLPEFGGAGSGPLTPQSVVEATDSLILIGDVLDAGEAVRGIPTAASATMNGIVFVNVERNSLTEVIGNLTLNADFQSARISGATSDFGIYSGFSPETLSLDETMTGALTVADADLTENDLGLPVFSTGLTGALTSAAGTYTVDGEMLGVIVTINGNALAGGDVTGNVTGPDATTTLMDEGTFLAFE